MQFSTAFIAFIALAASAIAAPNAAPEGLVRKREISYGNPDLVVDQGNRWKLIFGSTDGHPNACPGHYICYIYKSGSPHKDQSWGNPDDMVDEGDRWRFSYPDSGDGPCGEHYICYYNK